MFWIILLSVCHLLKTISSFYQPFNNKEKLIFGIIILASYYPIDKSNNLSFMLGLIIVRKILGPNSKEDKTYKFNIKTWKYKLLRMLLTIF